LGLFQDHIVYVNDLASYDKEKRAYETGRTTALANVVDVMQRLLSLGSAEEAKQAAYLRQLQLERSIADEIGRLKEEGHVEHEEWEFVRACLVMLGGHVLASSTMKRYGGEAARMAVPWTTVGYPYCSGWQC
jgi:hypothetical protein